MPGTKFKVVIWYGLAIRDSTHSDWFRTPIDSGGGVGGLTLAVALSKYPDIDVEVFEAARQFTEIGAGLGIWPRDFEVQIYSRR